MPKRQNIEWTRDMYAYLAWRLFAIMYGATEWYEGEEKRIQKHVAEARETLDTFLRKVVDNRARRLSNEYQENALYSFEKTYWHEFHDDDDEYIRSPIEYDEQYSAIWSEAVRKRLVVKMTYDSATSGVSERLVDPYQTRSPYGDGYCHTRKEVRKFRFDRIIDVTLTDQTFEKSKNWRETVKKYFI